MTNNPNELPQGYVDKLKRAARRLTRELSALSLAARDSRVPWYAKVLIVGVIAYALSPIDLIPDPIPVLGYLDDLVLVPMGIAIALWMIPEPVMEECRARARDLEPRKTALSWFVAALIVLVWIGAIVWFARIIMRYRS